MIRMRCQGGFSLVEVLVALVVIAIGLLGIAGMQALAITSTNQARLRSLAAIEAAGMVAAMRANSAYWASPTNFAAPPGQTTIIVDDTAVTGGPASADCEAGACAAAQMAGWTLAQWGPELAGVLPGGTGAINCSAPIGGNVTCSVTVSWNETQVKAMNSAADAAAAAARNYTLTVQP